MSLFTRSRLPHSPPSRTVPLATTMALLAVMGGVTADAQLPPPPEPVGNLLTPAKANLGKTLFWDEQISSTRTVACGTCHISAVGGEDPRSGVDPLAVHPGPDDIFGNGNDVFGSPGVPENTSTGLYQWNTHFGLLPQVTNRRTVSTINAGYAPELFWEGRAPGEFVDPVTQVVVPGLETGAALESQAVGPPVSDIEMGHVGRVWTEVLTRIDDSQPLALSPEVPTDLVTWIAGRSYADLFGEAFGDPAITAPRVAKAIASYERTLVSDQTPLDLFFSGQGPPLTAQEDAGLDVFNGVGLCKNCHDSNPPLLLTDHSFRYTGVTAQSDDPGRMDVTADPNDEGKMRVPLLRNLELRAPFMHNGGLETLEDVIDFYDQGGFFSGPNKDPLIVPLGLTQQEKDDLLAFLTRPLTDPRVAAEAPPFDRPTLYTESDRVPVVEGSGQPGTGDNVPEVVALEPPLIGNPSFTVGVWNGLGAAQASLAIDDQDPGLSDPLSGDFFYGTITLDGAGAGNGFGSISVAIPDDAALAGKTWFGRWYVADTGGGFPVAVSKVFRFRTFAVEQQTAIFTDGFESGDTSAWSQTVP